MLPVVQTMQGYMISAFCGISDARQCGHAPSGMSNDHNCERRMLVILLDAMESSIHLMGTSCNYTGSKKNGLRKHAVSRLETNIFLISKKQTLFVIEANSLYEKIMSVLWNNRSKLQ